MTAFVAGFAFTATPGKVGEVVKSVLLKRRFGTSLSATAASLLVERVTDLLAMLGLAVAGLAAGGAGGRARAPSRATGRAGSSVAGALALAAAIAFLLSERLRAPGDRRARPGAGRSIASPGRCRRSSGRAASS